MQRCRYNDFRLFVVDFPRVLAQTRIVFVVEMIWCKAEKDDLNP